MSKVILSLLFVILAPSSVFAFTDLGSLTEYTCIVEIEESSLSGGEADTIGYQIFQTCNENEARESIAKVTDMSLSQIQIQVIKTMRPSFALISTHSSNNDGHQIASMIFQKR